MWPLTILLGVSFLGVALTDAGTGGLLPEKKERRKLLILLILAVLLCWTLLSGALLVWWTGEDSAVIKGIQGRYFLPFLFCLLLCLPKVRIRSLERDGKAPVNIQDIALAVYLLCSAATIVLLGIRL